MIRKLAWAKCAGVNVRSVAENALDRESAGQLLAFVHAETPGASSKSEQALMTVFVGAV